jgi:hypothetical protein
MTGAAGARAALDPHAGARSVEHELGENRVQPIEFKNVRIAKPVAVVAEVPEAGPRAERQHDRGRPCAIGSTT